MLAAVNHSGDSDSTGAIAGNLLGMMFGAGAIPAEWLDALELRDVIATVGEDLYRHFASQARDWDDDPAIGGRRGSDSQSCRSSSIDRSRNASSSAPNGSRARSLGPRGWRRIIQWPPSRRSTSSEWAGGSMRQRADLRAGVDGQLLHAVERGGRRRHHLAHPVRREREEGGLREGSAVPCTLPAREVRGRGRPCRSAVRARRESTIRRGRRGRSGRGAPSNTAQPGIRRPRARWRAVASRAVRYPRFPPPWRRGPVSDSLYVAGRSNGGTRGMGRIIHRRLLQESRRVTRAEGWPVFERVTRQRGRFCDVRSSARRAETAPLERGLASFSRIMLSVW